MVDMANNLDENWLLGEEVEHLSIRWPCQLEPPPIDGILPHVLISKLQFLPIVPELPLKAVVRYGVRNVGFLHRVKSRRS